ncbi:MAG: hypothetical protein A2Z29_07610 [Chloroflexi bacterium RBG_16_56_11]|nr:MAG: hypothetical protein A2Z29_07610 [Chloroflexi bacterium RBG_16_56_11]
MGKFRYSEWDGTQNIFEPDADALMQDLERQLMYDGDLTSALRMMQRSGLMDDQGRRLPSLQDLIQRLRQRRQEHLDKYKLGSVLDEIRQKLDDILKTEKQGIQDRLDEARQKAADTGGDLSSETRQKLLKSVEDRASHSLDKLKDLPPDIGGQIKELSQYDFMDEDARRQFQELMEMLKRNAMSSFARDMTQRLQSMDAESLAAMRHFLEAVNQMLEARRRGEEPDFEGFMRQFGQFFGDNPPKDLDELIDRLQKQIAQAQSLMESLSPEDRRQLEDLIKSMLDESTQYELSKLASNLESLYPGWYKPQPYPFSGEESLSYNEALKLMEQLQKMDGLEDQLEESQRSQSLEEIDKELLKELMGKEAAEELERMRAITKVLEEAGYIRWKDGKYELTPRGMRKIGQKALQNIFARLRRDRTGGHRLDTMGSGGERTDVTKKYEFGDDLNLHIQRTIMNAIYREPQNVPVKMRVDDFEVFRMEAATRSATVLMLDLSLSMPMRGNFEAAKRVAVALDNLIRGQYPKDSLYIVGFSSYARQIKKEDLTRMRWDEFDPYTNLQHGLHFARKLLSREICTNKQIILVTDGEPTAHFEGKYLYFRFPPSLRTLQLTMKEVRRCTQKSIVINTFMLEGGRSFSAFVRQMARINKGRVFYTTADNLGQYLLVDFISNRSKKVR